MNDDIIFYGALNNKNKSVQGYAYSVYGVDGICATITTGCGGGHIPLILEENMEEVKRIGNLYGEDRGTGFAGNVWDKNGLLPSLTTCQGGGREPMIIDTINDEEGICKTIKSQYGKTSAANFDRVSTFGASGVVDKTIKKVGQISSEGSEYGTVISEEGLCSNLVAETHGYANSCICASEKMIVAMRGRNPENPTDRTPGIHTEQRLEPAPQGVDNTLTTVQKDNLVLETEKPFIKVKQATQKGYIECPEGG
jgi:hypothetical protein